MVFHCSLPLQRAARRDERYRLFARRPLPLTSSSATTQRHRAQRRRERRAIALDPRAVAISADEIGILHGHIAVRRDAPLPLAFFGHTAVLAARGRPIGAQAHALEHPRDRTLPARNLVALGLVSRARGALVVPVATV